MTSIVIKEYKIVMTQMSLHSPTSSRTRSIKLVKMSFDSDCGECSGYEFCSRRNSLPGKLPFEPSSIENIILTIGDKFDFRVLITDEKLRGAALVTAGLAVAGGLIGNAYGGKMGAVLGGAVGGACGLGIVAMSMREVWQEIRTQLSDVFDLVYDYLAGLGYNDYVSAAAFIASQNPHTKILATMILNSSTEILGKQLVSSLNSITSA